MHTLANTRIPAMDDSLAAADAKAIKKLTKKLAQIQVTIEKREAGQRLQPEEEAKISEKLRRNRANKAVLVFQALDGQGRGIRLAKPDQHVQRGRTDISIRVGQ